MTPVSQDTLRGDDPDARCAHVVLYCADGTDRELSLSEVQPRGERDDELLWIDIDCESEALVRDVCGKLRLPATVAQQLVELGSTPMLGNYGDHFVLHAVAVEHRGDLQFDGAVLGIAAGPGFVVTVHHRPIAFIPALREREEGETSLGQLTANSFVASLLDWQIGTYFEAVSDFERSVERLEEAVLRERHGQSIGELRRLRQGASRLRRMLAPHRQLFASLARPDFHPDDDRTTSRHFERADEHFERAMDIVENARDLVIGTFELFSSQTALRTNNTMRALTFATVVIGCQTVIAGILGMNFEAPFFKSAGVGFWAAVAAMALVGVVAFFVWKRTERL